MPQNAIMITVSILLALIIKAALETAFKPFFDGSQTWQAFYGLPLAQLCVFFVLIFRFYLGALRFSNTEPKRVDFVIRTFNFVFAFMVFSGFYVIALAVTLPKYFYLCIVVLHGIDVAWRGNGKHACRLMDLLTEEATKTGAAFRADRRWCRESISVLTALESAYRDRAARLRKLSGNLPPQLNG